MHYLLPWLQPGRRDHRPEIVEVIGVNETGRIASCFYIEIELEVAKITNTCQYWT